jgi:hypothetical protein
MDIQMHPLESLLITWRNLPLKLTMTEKPTMSPMFLREVKTLPRIIPTIYPRSLRGVKIVLLLIKHLELITLRIIPLIYPRFLRGVKIVLLLPRERRIT